MTGSIRADSPLRSRGFLFFLRRTAAVVALRSLTAVAAWEVSDSPGEPKGRRGRKRRARRSTRRMRSPCSARNRRTWRPDLDIEDQRTSRERQLRVRNPCQHASTGTSRVDRIAPAPTETRTTSFRPVLWEFALRRYLARLALLVPSPALAQWEAKCLPSRRETRDTEASAANGGGSLRLRGQPTCCIARTAFSRSTSAYVSVTAGEVCPRMTRATSRPNSFLR